MAKILIGISGSIAAYKAVLLVRELSQHGHHCKVVVTSGGLCFVKPEQVAGLGIAVYWDEQLQLADPTAAMLHINLAKWADLIILVPATADLIAKIAGGFADSLLTQIVLVAGGAKCCIAPAMNQAMWTNSLTQENFRQLKLHGFEFYGPGSGLQACGDRGEGRMLEPIELIRLINARLAPPDAFASKTILLTLGATQEAIDPVRYLTNYSSGKMGLALLNAALQLGAKVIALTAKVSVELPQNPNLIRINCLSAEEMYAQAFLTAPKADIMIACAAVCDYRVSSISPGKIKKTAAASLVLELIKNPDIVAECKRAFPRLFCVGFAAETENLVEYSQQKLVRKNLDMIIANLVGQELVFDQEDSQVTIIRKDLSLERLAKLPKKILAEQILDHIKQAIDQ